MKSAFRALTISATSLALSTSALAQVAPAPAVVAMPVAQAADPQSVLPANTELLLSMNDELTTKGIDEGHKFRLSVVHDVVLGGHVVIPRGTPAVGEVTWKTGKGAFGKSGKMEIALRYVDLGGRRIPIEGTYRQEGEGNTAATIAGVIAAGVFAGFITGKSARIPQGRELKAHTTEALPVVLAGGASAPAAVPVAAPVIAVKAPVAAAVAAPAVTLTAAPAATVKATPAVAVLSDEQLCSAKADKAAPFNPATAATIKADCLKARSK